MTPAEADGWEQYKLLILDRLQRVEERLDAHDAKNEARFIELRADISGIRADIASLKVRSGLWGAAAGMIPSLIALVIFYLETR